jgi:hypothetical protein
LKPAFGVVVELLGLITVLASSSLIPAGAPFDLYVIVAEILATYLIHCPAHYAVGTVVGIRFRRIRVGRSTLARALPTSLSPIAKLLPILTLSVDRESMKHIPKSRVAAMYGAGAVASVSAAVAIALAVTPSGLWTSTLAWAVALAYLAFDLVFSPKSGDFARARAALV